MILAINGQIVEKASIDLHAGTGFDISHLPNGLHIVQISAGEVRYAGRFVVFR
ncbi:MAG: T9SS type A sorting domain-containing protein [Phaeodactylibacter sp.]|nr:T9SS type A sorting domain-containing protein [Phaeodactylibacter sp.]